MKYDSMNCKCGKNVILVCKTTEKNVSVQKILCFPRSIYKKRLTALEHDTEEEVLGVSSPYHDIGRDDIVWSCRMRTSGASTRGCLESMYRTQPSAR